MAVDEDLHDAAVHEDTQVEQLPLGQKEAAALRHVDLGITGRGGIRRVDGDDAVTHAPAAIVKVLAGVAVKIDRRILRLVRGAQHVDPDEPCFSGIDAGPDLHCVATHLIQHDFLVDGQLDIAQFHRRAAQRLDVARRRDQQTVILPQNVAPRQRHDLRPALLRASLGDVVDAIDPALAVGTGRWRVDAAAARTARVQIAAPARDKALARPVVVAHDIHGAVHVAVGEQDVPLVTA